jgi:hypothetical protein
VREREREREREKEGEREREKERNRERERERERGGGSEREGDIKRKRESARDLHYFLRPGHSNPGTRKQEALTSAVWPSAPVDPFPSEVDPSRTWSSHH